MDREVWQQQWELSMQEIDDRLDILKSRLQGNPGAKSADVNTALDTLLSKRNLVQAYYDGLIKSDMPVNHVNQEMTRLMIKDLKMSVDRGLSTIEE